MEYMTQSQIAALIIGIVFSVISVATTILTIKNAEKLNTFAKAISASIIAPFIAFVGWLFLIFSFIDGFRNDETLTLIIAILLSIVIAGMVIIVSKALYNKHQADYEDEKEGEEVSENESEQEDNTQNAGTKEPLMITGPANVQENAQEEVSVDAKEVESEELTKEPQVEESAETESEEIADASEVEQDKNIEQKSEEQTEEQSETEEASEDETAVESEVETDEIVAVEAPQDKNAIASVDESVEELNNEEPQEETQKKKLTQEEQDDLEFEKFLESLGKNSSSEDNDDNK
mgnify:CR=1 FL=1